MSNLPAHSAGHEPPLTIEEAAAFLNVTERWVRRAVAERRLTYVKLGHHVRFMVEDLRAHLASNKVEPMPPAQGRFDHRLHPFPSRPPRTGRGPARNPAAS